MCQHMKPSGMNDIAVSFKATAIAQGLQNVLDPSYTPPGHDKYAVEIFKEQHNFIYSVLHRIIQTDKGRTLVREYDQNPQEILYELHEDQTNSEIARNEVPHLRNTYITNLKLTNAWKGTTRQFLMHFTEKFRLLDSLNSVHDHFSQSTSITFLSQAVKAVLDLRGVKTVESVMRAKAGSFKPNDFQTYFHLFHNA